MYSPENTTDMPFIVLTSFFLLWHYNNNSYTISILPFGIGAMLSGLFYLILIIVVITGIKIVSSGFGEWVMDKKPNKKRYKEE